MRWATTTSWILRRWAVTRPGRFPRGFPIRRFRFHTHRMAFSFTHSHGSVLKVSHRCYASFSSTFDSVSFSSFECFPFQPHRWSVSCFCRCVFRSLPVSFVAWVGSICNLVSFVLPSLTSMSPFGLCGGLLLLNAAIVRCGSCV